MRFYPLDVNEVLKSLSNPARLTIVQKLKEPKKNFRTSSQLVDADQEGVSVSLIQETTGLSQSTVSIYLANLQRAGLVSSNRIGAWTYYKRNERNIQIFLKQLSEQI